MGKTIGIIIGGFILSLFVLFLYLNNGQVITKHYEVDNIMSFDCSDNNQYLYYHFFNGDMSYVIKSSKDGKSIDMAKYRYRIVLGRDLGGGFWQFPKPYFITLIFSTRKLNDDEMAAKIEYKLINKVGYGLSDSTFGSIGSHGYKKNHFFRQALKNQWCYLSCNYHSPCAIRFNCQSLRSFYEKISVAITIRIGSQCPCL